MTSQLLLVLQEELAVLTAQQQQLSASESASRQQLAASVQAHEQASAACTSAEAELHRLSMALGDSEAQLVLAHQNEAQVISPYMFLEVCLLHGGPAFVLTLKVEDRWYTVIRSLVACHVCFTGVDMGDAPNISHDTVR